MSDSVNAADAFQQLIASLEDLPATLTIPLSPPVSFDNKEYAQLVLREPKSGEVEQAEQQLRNGMAPNARRNYEMHLVAKIAEVPFPVVQKAGVTRLNVAMQYINLFLGAGRGTGGP